MLLCTTVVHNTAQNSSDNLPSVPPDIHHKSDTDTCEEAQPGIKKIEMLAMRDALLHTPIVLLIQLNYWRANGLLAAICSRSQEPNMSQNQFKLATTH